MKTALSIAGFDPSSGAGVSADLAVFSAHGVLGTAAVSALTVQSTLRVKAVAATDQGLLAAMLAELNEDLPPDGIKVGMLANAGCVAVVADFVERIRQMRPVPLVLDPVLVASSGAALLDGPGTQALVERLLPLATWATPNRAEWAVLAGVDREGWKDRHAFEQSCANGRTRWPNLGLVVTGGDEERADDLVLPPGEAAVWLEADKIQTNSTHGTGCAFSSALLCGLLAGQDGVTAARAAKAYVIQAILLAPGVGKGRGPLNLLWPLTAQAAT